MAYQDILQQLKSIEAQKAELEQQLQAARAERKRELLAEIRDRLDEEGFSLEEFCGQPAPKRKTRASSGSRSYPVYALNDDPSLTYSRGVLPGWMKQRMSDLGLDSSSKEDRERFKQEHMTPRQEA